MEPLSKKTSSVSSKDKKRKIAEITLDPDYMPTVMDNNTVAKRLKFNNCDWQKNRGETFWQGFLQQGTLCVCNFQHIVKGEIPKDFNPPPIKVAGFDLDSTLIVSKSGQLFGKSPTDWKLWHESVKPKLEELDKDGYRIIIFTNQGGVEAGKTTVLELQQKFTNIQKHLNISMAFFAATQSDNYRKPALGMWKYLCDDYFKGFEIDMKNSFYCGDAAGRPKTATRPKDFTDTDLKFAVNVGLKFYTPEQLFLGEKDATVNKITNMFKKQTSTKEEEKKEGAGAAPVNYKSDKQELLLLMGAPGSGKSTFQKHHLQGYERVNQDTLGTPEKCKKACEAFLLAGKSVVIDNTNKTVEQRSRYIAIAKALKIPYRIFIMDADKPRCMHNNKQRKTNPHHQHLSKKVGDVIIHDFFKNKEMPTAAEGFSEIRKIEFKAGPFDSKEDEETYNLLS